MAKKKAAKKPAAKRTVKKAGGKKPRIKKRSAKKSATKNSPVKRPSGVLSVQVTPALEGRLKTLARSMGKPMDGLLVQALGEFADNWEDHMRTVNALNEGDDRVQLVVPTV